MKKIPLILTLIGLGAMMRANAQDTTFVRIHKIPAKVIVTMNTDSIYLGQKATLSVANCTGTVTWSTGQTGTSIQVSPTKEMYFSASCHSSFGCIGPRDSVKVLIRKPIVLGASPATLCAGDSSVLTATGCINGTLSWNNGGVGNRIVVKPNATTQYSVTCTQPHVGTSSSFSINVNVNPTPAAPTLSASPQSIKTGENVTITANGCTGTVTWSNGKTGTSILEKLTKTSTFTAYCTSPQGCRSINGSITIGVDSPIPIVNVNPGELCEGQSVTLTASGCSMGGTYEWRDSQEKIIGTTPTLTLTATANQTLKVICKDSAGASQPRLITLKSVN